MGISLASRVTAGICGLTIVLQLWQSGRELAHAARHHLLPPAPRVAGAVASIGLALWSFVLAALDSDRYWLWHSLWHVGMGVGYYLLYVYLLGPPYGGEVAPSSRGRRRQRGKAAAAAVGGPLGIIPGEAGLQDLLQALRGWLPGASPSPEPAEPPAQRPRRNPSQAGGKVSPPSGATPTTTSKRRGRSSSRGAGGRSRSRSRGKARATTRASASNEAALQPRSSGTAAGGGAAPAGRAR